ncbi:MAG: hypothetical protein KKF74_01410 [Nanoarchaeota archaeon]|nr:hypothetical protein [Nanoarchaeota archaeon]
MKPKRVLIASFALIILGLFFIVGPETSITGAVVGVQSGVLDSTSNILFGFFLVWIAGIILIGGVEEKVVDIKTLKKRSEEVGKFIEDYNFSTSQGYVKGIEKTGKKPSELNSKDRVEIVDNIYNTKKEVYLNFLGLKGAGNDTYGKPALEQMHYTQTGTNMEDKNKLAALTPTALADVSEKTGHVLEERLGGYMFADINDKNFEKVKDQVAQGLNIDAKKIKTKEELRALYNALINKEAQDGRLKNFRADDYRTNNYENN